MISEYNRRINFKSWGASQDPGGGPIAILLASYSVWAKVEPRSGQLYTGTEQRLWAYDYQITFRYEKSRPVPSNYTIDYDGKRLAINSVSYLSEGTRWYAVARCTTIDANIDNTSDVFATVHTFDYYGIGGESVFTADSTLTPIGSAPPNSQPWIAVDLRGHTIIGAFKDGEEFAVLLSGIPNPGAKEVVYNSALGSFTWSIEYEPDEHTLIQYL